MTGKNSTLGQAAAAGVVLKCRCENGHDYTVDPAALIDLVGSFHRLDEALLTRSWCPDCGQLAAEFEIELPR